MVMEQGCWSGFTQTSCRTGSQSISFLVESSEININYQKEGTIPVLLQFRPASITSNLRSKTQNFWEKNRFTLQIANEMTWT